MNDQAFLQNQVLELQRLLDLAGDDPVARPQLRERLSEAEENLREISHQDGSVFPKEIIVFPRTAIFLRGRAVHGSDGISPGLAGEALIQYEKMFTAQAIHDEREAGRTIGRQRRPRGAPTPELLFTGTPRGSFGLEFIPKPTEGESQLAVHAQSLRNLADTLVLVAETAGRSLDDAIKQIPSPVLQPLKQFIKTLAGYGADVRLAFSDRPSRLLSSDQVRTAAEQLEKEVTQEIVPIEGTFRGVTRDSGVFDLRTHDGAVITGTVADGLTEEDIEQIDLLTNKLGVAQLQKTVVSTITGKTIEYVLLNAAPIHSQGDETAAPEADPGAEAPSDAE